MRYCIYLYMLAVKKAQFSRMDLMISDLIGVPSGAMRQMGKDALFDEKQIVSPPVATGIFNYHD